MSTTTQTQKLSTWQPQQIPMSEEECEQYRVLIRQSIFASWRNKSRASPLQEIYLDVVRRVRELIETGDWDLDFAQYPRSKRTIDRRVNETASPKFYPHGVVMVVAVSAGVYMPNPQLFMFKQEPNKKSRC
ncbi:MAG: hypothetical protein PHH61_06415 [Candidatus Nanoarchaeia archaeon]|nr:hypothetical protein [Candidatus Nanoarchaeia archaeon]